MLDLDLYQVKLKNICSSYFGKLALDDRITINSAKSDSNDQKQLIKLILLPLAT